MKLTDSHHSPIYLFFYPKRPGLKMYYLRIFPRWKGYEKFVLEHTLPFGTALDIDYIPINGEHYLAVSNPKTTRSSGYRGNDPLGSKLYKIITYWCSVSYVVSRPSITYSRPSPSGPIPQKSPCVRPLTSMGPPRSFETTSIIAEPAYIDKTAYLCGVEQDLSTRAHFLRKNAFCLRPFIRSHFFLRPCLCSFR